MNSRNQKEDRKKFRGVVDKVVLRGKSGHYRGAILIKPNS